VTLIAIEMKKADRPEEEKNKDRDWLRAMIKERAEIWPLDGNARPKHVSGYVLGYFIEIDRDKQTFSVGEYHGGKLVDGFDGNFREATSS
jgi:hypothetical protein